MALARQEALPGMEDRKLKDIHEAALNYADLRDARIEASGPEVDAKATLLQLMKKHQLEHYKFNGVEVDLVHEKENVKVKVHAGGEDGEAAAEGDGMPTLPDAQKKAVKKIPADRKKKKKAKKH